MNDTDLRRLLGENAAHTARARRQAGVIRDKAAEALDGAQKRLAGLSPAAAMLDDAKGHEYRQAVGERARLSILLGSSSS